MPLNSKGAPVAQMWQVLRRAQWSRIDSAVTEVPAGENFKVA
jgi:hypothetical protein